MSQEFYGANLSIGPDSKSWNSRNGWLIRRPYTGTPVAIQVAINSLLLDKIDFDHEAQVEGGYERIWVHLAQEDTQDRSLPIIDEWERDSNMIEKDIWEIPKVQAEFQKAMITNPDAVSFGAIAKFRADLEALVRGETTTTLPDGTNTLLVLDDLLNIATELGMDGQVFLDMFYSLARGTKSKSIPHYVMRRVRVVGHDTTIKPDDANTGRVYETTSDFQTREGIPDSTLKWSMPEGIWLKMAADVKPFEGNRWKVTQEFWWAEFYDPFVYDRAV